jgi:hypothetical protein
MLRASDHARLASENGTSRALEDYADRAAAIVGPTIGAAIESYDFFIYGANLSNFDYPKFDHLTATIAGFWIGVFRLFLLCHGVARIIPEKAVYPYLYVFIAKGPAAWVWLDLSAQLSNS